MEQVTKNTRRSAKGRFTRKVKDFLAYEKNSEPMPVITIKYTEVKDAWENLERIHDDYMCNMEDCETVEGDAWIDEPQQMYNDVVKKYMVLKRTETRVTKGLDTESHSSKIHTLQLETTKLPRFSGDIRDYAHFKYDFQKYVEPNVPETIVAYTLKSCLSKTAAHKVRNEDDIASMWTVLDDIYADPGMVADVIMDDIERTRAFENGETTRFIEFVDRLEDGHCDLCKLGLQKELTTTSSVSIVEQKLSPEMKTRWSRAVVCPESTVDRSDKFKSLLAFLKVEKRTLEYRCAALRRSEEYVEGAVQHVEVSAVPDLMRLMEDSSQRGTNTCLIHRNTDHRTEDCVQYLFMSVDQRMALLRRTRACWACLQCGHQCRECMVSSTCGENGCRRRHHRTLHKTEITMGIHRVNHIFGEEIQKITERPHESDSGMTCENRSDTRLSNSSRVKESDKRITSLERRLKDQEKIHRAQMDTVCSENATLKADNDRLSQRNVNLSSSSGRSGDQTTPETPQMENHRLLQDNTTHSSKTQQHSDETYNFPLCTRWCCVALSS